MTNRLWETKDNVKNKENLMESTVAIVSAYLSNNIMDPASVLQFIPQVFSAVLSLQHHAMNRNLPQAAIDVENSVTDDYIVCLEDGKKLKMLRRHLRTTYKMTPDQYRERWGLPADYPMVAPNYARRRSDLAKNHGLGNRKMSYKIPSTLKRHSEIGISMVSA